VCALQQQTLISKATRFEVANLAFDRSLIVGGDIFAKRSAATRIPALTRLRNCTPAGFHLANSKQSILKLTEFHQAQTSELSCVRPLLVAFVSGELSTDCS